MKKKEKEKKRKGDKTQINIEGKKETRQQTNKRMQFKSMLQGKKCSFLVSGTLT